MAFGEPVRNYALAVLPNAANSLAAVGIAKNLAVFFESPIIMVLHASNALARDKNSSRKFLVFTLIFSILLSLAFLGLATPYIFNYIATSIFSLSFAISADVQTVIIYIFLWPFIIGWRRYFQGLLIQSKLNSIVAYASIFRLVFVIGLPILGIKLNWSGILCASSSLIGGIFAEAIFVTLFSLKKNLFFKLDQRQELTLPQTYPQIATYYFPLAISMIVIWGTRAFLVFILSYAIDSKTSLTSWPIIWGLVLVVSNGTRMIQQVYISEKKNHDAKVFKYFVASVGLFFSLIILALLFTSGGQAIISYSLGNVQYLLSDINYNLLIACLFPLLTTIQNFEQGKLVIMSSTKQISYAAVISNIVILICALYFIFLAKISGSTSLMISFNIGIIAEILLYRYYLKKLSHS